MVGYRAGAGQAVGRGLRAAAGHGGLALEDHGRVHVVHADVLRALGDHPALRGGEVDQRINEFFQSIHSNVRVNLAQLPQQLV